MEEQLLEKIPPGINVTRQEIMQDFPKGDEFKSLQRDLKRALDNLERQMLVVKQFEDVPGRRRKALIIPPCSWRLPANLV